MLALPNNLKNAHKSGGYQSAEDYKIKKPTNGETVKNNKNLY